MSTLRDGALQAAHTRQPQLPRAHHDRTCVVPFVDADLLPSLCRLSADRAFLVVSPQPINLPQAPLFCPTITVIVRDTKLGGLVHSTIGLTSIPLLDKVGVVDGVRAHHSPLCPLPVVVLWVTCNNYPCSLVCLADPLVPRFCGAVPSGL
jgi:hypothetical protein